MVANSRGKNIAEIVADSYKTQGNLALSSCRKLFDSEPPVQAEQNLAKKTEITVKFCREL